MTKTATDEVLYKINDEIDSNINNMQKFKLFGKILGKAVFDRIPMNLSFCRPLIKSLLGKKIELNDMKFFDSQVIIHAI